MLKRLEIAGFKSFARKTVLDFSSDVTAIVGPNGSGKSNTAEAFRFALGEQSMKSMRGKKSEDLIFSGTHNAPRSNRAAVTIIFDNTNHIFKLDFEEVAIERAVFRDGTSEYSINGSKVRLRDIQELLAGANIGSSAHHIISQGEADRILLASSRERREMLEDALGLKTYEFKKQDANRKLERTRENISQVEALRREVAPHVRFLAKQVEKINRADELRKDLIRASKTYLAREDAYIEREYEIATATKDASSKRLADVSADLAKIEAHTTNDEESGRRMQIVRDTEMAFERATEEHTALAREIGRVDGTLASAEARSREMHKDSRIVVSREDLLTLRDEVSKQVNDIGGDPASISAALTAIHKTVQAFVNHFVQSDKDSKQFEQANDGDEEIQTLLKEKVVLSAREAALASDIEKLRNALQRARENVVAHEEANREERRHLLENAETKAREEATVTRATARLAELAVRRENCEQDKAELLAIAGSEAVSYDAITDVSDEEVARQVSLHKDIERLKIRLEEAGGTGEDIRKEYKEATEREEFLARELSDLTKSADGLQMLIKDLDSELAKHFSDGLARVNASFNNSFSLMFNGGGAELILEDSLKINEDEDTDGLSRSQSRPGIDISVHLPKKRLQSLTQLSGGERALTSIALIFAMSQVNPPPFLILDETDAALDEENSRRYGDMIENLAKRSQLIVITHNRETMSRASILYGVTMGADGISKLLSVKFDEAVAVAK